MKTYALGTDVICSVVFKDVTGVEADPTAVLFSVIDANNTQTDYTYGVGGFISKDATGRYHANVDANLVGLWHYRFYATGTGKAADEGSFLVKESAFA